MISVAVSARILLIYSLFRSCTKAIGLSKQTMEEFPKTLEDFGYGFNNYGQLRELDHETKQPTDQPFKFDYLEGNHHFNQRRYEALGEVINEHIYSLLEKEGQLVKQELVGGADGTTNEQKTFIFRSKDAFENKEKLLVLIHGSGVVRAGQWARRLIINDNLDTGTQLPFIKKAQEEGYAVIVTNTNDNSRLINGKKMLIRGSENPANHLLTVWEEVIEKSPAKHIAFIAHSYGGVCVLQLASHIDLNKFKSRVFAIAMTDSVHNMVHHDTIDRSLQQFLCQIGRNWVSSGNPLDAKIKSAPDDIQRVSAGHTQHEMTSYVAMPSIFKFLSDKLDEVTRNNGGDGTCHLIKEDEIECKQLQPPEKQPRLEDVPTKL